MPYCDHFIVDRTKLSILAKQYPESTIDNPLPSLSWIPIKSSWSLNTVHCFTDQDILDKACEQIKSMYPGRVIEAYHRLACAVDKMQGKFAVPVIDPLVIQQQEDKIKSIVESHFSNLSRKKNQLAIVDDYGNTEDKKWKKEIKYFIEKIIKPCFTEANMELLLDNSKASDIIDCLIDFNGCAYVDKLDINTDPVDYEHYCSDLLRQHGWTTRATPTTGDQGVDIIASKNDRIGAIQCKKYSTPVGNKAVQEVYAGMNYIGAHFCAVVTNAGYTQSAKELAQTLGVFLLHHDELSFLDEQSPKQKPRSVDGEQYEQLQVMVSLHTKRGLERLAKYYRVTQQEALERAIVETQDRLLASLSSADQKRFYDGKLTAESLQGNED